MVIKAGQKANFTGVEMVGAEGFYHASEQEGHLKTLVDRLIDGGRREGNIKANWINGVEIERRA